MTAIRDDFASPPVRVMVVDDSAAIRGALTRLLEADPGIRVVARAADGAAAIRTAQAQPLEVVILDIEMPGLDGLSALPLLLRARPAAQVIMASTLTTRGAGATLQALRLGAADYVAKPGTAAASNDDFRTELLAKVKALGRRAAAAQGDPGRPAGNGAAATLAGTAPTATPGTAPPSGLVGPNARPNACPNTSSGAFGQAHGAVSRITIPAGPRTATLLAIGSSTGGPQALFTLFQALGPRLPVPAVITQHMPAAFMPILAEQLDRLGGPSCRVARDGEPLEAGHAYLAPGERHLLVAQGHGKSLVASLSNGLPENHCRPAVDPMLRSAAVATEGRTLVVMLTGMGADGLAGTRLVVSAGGTALAQDEASSVVWGMPGAIAQAGLCHVIAPVPDLARTALALLSRRTGRGEP